MRMTKGMALRYRKAMVEGSSILTDEEAVAVPMLFERWEPGKHYIITDKRLYYNGKLYTVLQEHDSHAAYPPDITVSLYAEVLIPDPSVIPDWVQPLSTNGYKIGDKVRHNGKIWESDYNDNVWEPGVFGWHEIEE